MHRGPQPKRPVSCPRGVATRVMNTRCRQVKSPPPPGHLGDGMTACAIPARPTTGVQLLARAPQRVLTHAGRVTVSCNGMLGGAPGALLKRPSREAPAGNGTPVGPIRLPEL